MSWVGDLAEIDGDGSYETSDTALVWEGKVSSQVNSPNGISSNHTASKVHAKVDRCGLYNGANCHNDTHNLHKPTPSESVSNRDLRNCTERFTGDINSNDLSVLVDYLEGSLVNSLHLWRLSKDGPYIRSSSGEQSLWSRSRYQIPIIFG
jgi:hypothetical protein